RPARRNRGRGGRQARRNLRRWYSARHTRVEGAVGRREGLFGRQDVSVRAVGSGAGRCRTCAEYLPHGNRTGDEADGGQVGQRTQSRQPALAQVIRDLLITGLCSLPWASEPGHTADVTRIRYAFEHAIVDS